MFEKAIEQIIGESTKEKNVSVTFTKVINIPAFILFVWSTLSLFEIIDTDIFYKVIAIIVLLLLADFEYTYHKNKKE